MCALLSLAHLSSPLVIHLESAKSFSGETDALCPGRSSGRRLPRQCACLAVWSGCTTLCEAEGREGEPGRPCAALRQRDERPGEGLNHAFWSPRSQRHARSAPASSSPVHPSGISCVGWKANRLVPSPSGWLVFIAIAVPPVVSCLSHCTSDTSSVRTRPWHDNTFDLFWPFSVLCLPEPKKISQKVALCCVPLWLHLCQVPI